MIQAAVPKLRFFEFSDIWEQSRLGDKAKFYKGKSISKADIDDKGRTPCIRYGELYTTYGEVIRSVDSRTSLPADGLIFSRVNDVIIPASGETALDIATASCVEPDGVALGGDLNIIRTSLSGHFLAYYLSHRKRKDIARLAQGNSVVHLYKDQIASLKIGIPNAHEQQKIADFLGAVDARIALLRRRRDALRTYKKGIMQRLFAEELRFTKDDGSSFPNWQEKRLSQVASRVTEKNSSAAIKLVLTNSAVKGIVSQQDYFDKEIANEDNLGGYYVVRKGDFVYNPRISVSAPVGPIKQSGFELGVMSPLYTVFRFKCQNERFFGQYFASSHWFKYLKTVANYGARHDRMAISTGDFMAMPLPCPASGEQQKIANFLSALDAKIDGAVAQVDAMQAFKKGLLQQMFV